MPAKDKQEAPYSQYVDVYLNSECMQIYIYMHTHTNTHTHKHTHTQLVINPSIYRDSSRNCFPIF